MKKLVLVVVALTSLVGCGSPHGGSSLTLAPLDIIITGDDEKGQEKEHLQGVRFETLIPLISTTTQF